MDFLRLFLDEIALGYCAIAYQILEIMTQFEVII